MLAVCIAAEPSFTVVIVGIGGVITGGGGVFGLEVDGVHDGVVLMLLG